ncbi:UDP-3-O-(3-hydroxymyristoyl)glucosamine N-acyltransferase [Mariniblastus fucicola]|uniref:UDP-3-O-acylglucosamine N-acyltransferase n=1 Tax=Mariniblastus fucicola TaxID=980251 RepID=A0A5B9P6D3_9BACT|nr:UDP-3-O-(3-hydroxymyristoyl)glucosamine N-acyltransferase [Mariniblastus fucicola]QEG22147.1 UDP-3-O-acylglucosamine N-acyltransferase [Mariniblastus fucicola]
MRQLQELAESINGTVAGSEQAEISGAATIARSRSGDITFAQSQKHYDEFLRSEASAVVVSRGVLLDSTRDAIIVDNALDAFTQIVSQFRPPVKRSPVGISPRAIVSDSADIADGACIHAGAVIMEGVTIGSGTTVFPNVTVMEGCVIGANCTLFPNCTLYEQTILGDRVVLHAGVVLGTWGFGYHSSANGHRISAQLGNVVVGNDVELGANTTIDRGTFDSTTIGDGTKMDDQVMVGHNCEIGKHNLFCSQVGIAGSCTTGDFVVMGGQVGLGDHLDIGSNVSIGAKSGLMHNVEPNQRIQGIPARPARQAMQIMAITGKLPEMRKEMKRLQKEIESLESNARPESIRDAA